ncbi:cobalamin B12-binding domain-containing protein [Roseicella aquatilis]|uniref:Cobalamin B12-binding domain-containing protein n=1 Tax=Roseicella aquatilis TaxID=2527868 RepID=A0A4R4DUQ1_9PROT|nr:cobalamin B12-binding domain-containing protein [Roseicella aquatilis]TCZ65997.1 cobalamin B12-binding domain-containing protein [Roseicella aquatilis]
MVALGYSAATRHRAEAQARPAPVLHAVPLLLEPDRRGARRAALARAVEDAVLPRLLLACRAAAARQAAATPLGPAEVERFCRLLIADDTAAIAAEVHGLRADGVPLGRLCLDLLAPAARRLGEAWESDGCDFATVTLGLMRMQHLLRDASPDFLRDAPRRARPRRILLANPPGEQHGFGRDMLEGFFRQGGWEVWDPPPRSAEAFAALVRREAFEVVGLSAGAEARLPAVAACIRAVRQSPRNRRAGIMVGGAIFLARPDCVALVGADATATDGQQAVLQAEHMLSLATHWD